MYISNGIVVVNNKAENKTFIYDKKTRQKYDVNEDLIILLDYIDSNHDQSYDDIISHFEGIDDVMMYLLSKDIITDDNECCFDKIKKIESFNSCRIFIECTDKCNLACPHCYGSFNAQNSSFIRPDTFEDLMIKCAKLGVYEIDLTGGEPFMHPNLPNIFDSLKKHSMLTTLFSNLTVCNEEMLDLIISSGIKTVVTSIESNQRIIHDRFRGLHGALNKTIECIKYLKRYGVEVKANFVLGGHNIYEADEIISFITSLEIPCNIDVTSYEGRARNLDFDINKAIEILKKYNNGDIISNCGIGKRMLFIAANGNVYPCPSVRDENYKFANVNHDYDLKSCFSKAFSSINNWACNQNCSVEQCPGGCRARALSMNGQITAPDPYYCMIYGKE